MDAKQLLGTVEREPFGWVVPGSSPHSPGGASLWQAEGRGCAEVSCCSGSCLGGCCDRKASVQHGHFLTVRRHAPARLPEAARKLCPGCTSSSFLVMVCSWTGHPCSFSTEQVAAFPTPQAITGTKCFCTRPHGQAC